MNASIGIFDSGLGGLTVVKEVIRQLPREDVVYYGDTARVPYGTKSRKSIIRFSRKNTLVLMQSHVKMIVVACNSSASYAMPTLRKHFRIPILGVIEPGVQSAIKTTKNRKVGVIATAATIASGSYEKKLKSGLPNVKVYTRPCPLLVPLVEEGRLDGPVTRAVVKEYIQPLLNKGIDTLILGCTHYPLLKSVIQNVAGKRVVLIDSAQAMALAVEKKLNALGLASERKRKAKYKLILSDKPQNFEKIAQRFLERKLPISVRRK